MAATEQNEKDKETLGASIREPDQQQQDSSGGDEAALEANVDRRSSVVEYSVFTKAQRRYIVFTASWAGFFSPLSSQIYFPALNAVAQDLNVSLSLINLTLTSYMVGRGTERPPRSMAMANSCYRFSRGCRPCS